MRAHRYCQEHWRAARAAEIATGRWEDALVVFLPILLIVLALFLLLALGARLLVLRLRLHVRVLQIDR